MFGGCTTIHPSEGCGIIHFVKRMCGLLAIAFPLLMAMSDGHARVRNFPAGLTSAHATNFSFASQVSTKPDPALVAKGRTRYLDYKCDECHGANGEGGEDGPDLIGTRLNAEEISKFLENPSPDAYMKGMPNIPANHPDNQVLVAYVMSLKRPANPDARPGQPTPSPSKGQVKSDPPVIRRLSAAEKAHILDGEFTIEYKVDRLPDSLKSAFSSLAKEHEFKMANPGEKYQETDYVSERELPWRRLIFSGISKGRYFIHYEKGGIAHTFYLAIFDVNSEGKVSFLWGGPGARAKGLTQLRSLVSTKAFGDNSNYW